MWVQLTHDRTQSQAIVSVVMNIVVIFRSSLYFGILSDYQFAIYDSVS